MTDSSDHLWTLFHNVWAESEHLNLDEAMDLPCNISFLYSTDLV